MPKLAANAGNEIFWYDVLAASPSGTARAAGIGVEMRYPWLYISTVPLNFVGILMVKAVEPREPVRAPSQVAPAAQAVAACAGPAASGAPTRSSPAAEMAATMRRVNVVFMSVLIYGSSLGVGAPGRYEAFLA